MIIGGASESDPTYSIIYRFINPLFDSVTYN